MAFSSGVRRSTLGLVAAVLLGFGCSGAWAQAAKTTLVVPPAPLLPATLGTLKRVAEGDSGDGRGGVDAADGAALATTLAEDGLKRFARSDYAEGAGHGTVTVYQFGDASGAFAAYCAFRGPGMRPHRSATEEKLGEDSAEDGKEVLFRSGVNVVQSSFDLRPQSADALRLELIGRLPKAFGPAAQPPLLPTLLPARGLEIETLKYALGPIGYQATGGVLPAAIVGFDKSAEVVTAKYAGRGTLTVLLYPTPQIAGAHGRQIEAEMNHEGRAAGTVKLRREGPLVAMTTGAWTAVEAQQMVESVHLRDELTWNKPMPPEFHAEVRKTVSLLTSILVLCGVLMLAAVVLALFFGGGRAMVRVMQGKSAATEPEFLRIDLRERSGDGGSFKPLH
jgi:hypothetical protein